MGTFTNHKKKGRTEMGTVFKQSIKVLICIALILQLSLLSAAAGKSDDVLRYASTREITKIDPYYTGQREAVLMVGKKGSSFDC